MQNIKNKQIPPPNAKPCEQFGLFVWMRISPLQQCFEIRKQVKTMHIILSWGNHKYPWWRICSPQCFGLHFLVALPPHSAAALVSLLFSLCSFVSWTSISVAGPLTFHCIFGFTYVKHSLGLCSLTVQPGTAFDKESLHNTFLEWWVMGNALVW